MTWQPIETAPTKSKHQFYGPEFLLRAEHHGHWFTVIARYHKPTQTFLDTNSASSVHAKAGDGSLWTPLPKAPEAQS